MTKEQHLKTTKAYLKKVVNMRKRLAQMSTGKPITKSMKKTIDHIEYYFNKHTADSMLNFISNPEKQTAILELIPSNKQVWKTELNHLVFEANILLGKTEYQTELNF